MTKQEKEVSRKLLLVRRVIRKLFASLAKRYTWRYDASYGTYAEVSYRSLGDNTVLKWRFDTLSKGLEAWRELHAWIYDLAESLKPKTPGVFRPDLFAPATTYDPREIEGTPVDAGRKDDEEKPDLTYLRDVAPAIALVCKVFAFGAQKYGRNNWRKVSADRYDKAALRHALASGLDSESGLPHEAHQIACLLIKITNEAKQ